VQNAVAGRPHFSFSSFSWSSNFCDQTAYALSGSWIIRGLQQASGLLQSPFNFFYTTRISHLSSPVHSRRAGDQIVQVYFLAASIRMTNRDPHHSSTALPPKRLVALDGILVAVANQRLETNKMPVEPE
jgi:hypothetical protein